jgi:glycosyltransferase involved in cell wall biosynthesis
MDFSVIIASRNRPVLLRDAIRSVLDQTHRSVEIVLVNDGTSSEHAAAYAAIKQELTGHGVCIDLRPTPGGHGQSYAYNRGAEVARGTYLCFLDDDDYWTDPEHLSRAWNALSAPDRQAEIYFANQRAYTGDVLIDRPIWLEGLEQQLKKRRQPFDDGVYQATIEELLECGNHAQVNITIATRELYERIGGLDENIRYECDVDFYLRLIDNAQGILYCPRYVSRHNAPDPSKALNMSTSMSSIAKAVSRASVWNKALLYSTSPAIRAAAVRAKGYALRNIALLLVQQGRTREASSFGFEALGVHFSFKWFVYCLYLGLRSTLVR